MKNTPALIGMQVLVFNILLAVAPDTLWTKTYGGPAGDKCYNVEETYDHGFVMVETYAGQLVSVAFCISILHDFN